MHSDLQFQLPHLALVGLLCKLYETVVPNIGLHMLASNTEKKAHCDVMLAYPHGNYLGEQSTIYHHKCKPQIYDIRGTST